MKIALLDIHFPGDKKDFNGGFGTKFKPGRSLLAKVLIWARPRKEYLPLLNYGYASSVLKKNGHEVSLVQNRVPQGADLIILHATLIRHNEEMEYLNKIRRGSKSKICIVGPLASEWPHLFDKVADSIIIGDFERLFLEIKSLEDIPRGQYKVSALKNLDELPFPDWSIYDYRRFSQYPLLRKTPTIFVQGSRSCPYKCNYCPYITSQKSYNSRSVQNVIEELVDVKSRYSAKSILFRDPVFSINKRWTQNLCSEMIKQNIGLEWACETRSDCLTEELIDQMYDAGLRAIKVGIESADQEILKNLKRKPPTLEHQDRVLNYAESKKIKVAAFYIVGLLDDTVESMELTLQQAIQLNTSYANFNLCTPLPGTEFYDQVKDRIFDHDLDNYDNYHSVFKNNFVSSEEIQHYMQKSMVSYYFRTGFFRKQLSYLFRN